MTKPKSIQWLENETGQEIPYAPESPAGQDRHLSVRLPAELAGGLEQLAVERGISLSQLVRELLNSVVMQRRTTASLDVLALAERLEADVAEVRRRLAG
jgi:Ribbon-helix-helix protein, copG family